jgi:malonate transporter and related proteins
MIDILALAMPFFALVALGLAASYLWQGNEAELKWLNVFVVYFALPALIFNIVAATPIETLSNLRFVVAAAGVTATAYFVAMVVAQKQFGLDPRRAALAATSASYGNVGYMGLSLAVAFFGAAAGVPAAIVFCIDCTILFLLTAIFAVERDDVKGRAALLQRIGIDIIKHPFIVATLLGIAASALHVAPAGAFKTVLDMLARAAGPCALFAMGLTVGLRRSTFGKPDVYAIAMMKLILQPAAMFAAMIVIGVENLDWIKTAVMMAALPTASNAFILARQYDSYVEGASASVMMTTILSAVTIPAIVYLLGG